MAELTDDYRELQDLAGSLGVPATGAKDELKARVAEALETNHSLVVDPAVASECEYVVTGPHKVLGHDPATKFRAAIPPEQEARLIRRGQIKPVEGANKSQEG